MFAPEIYCCHRCGLPCDLCNTRERIDGEMKYVSACPVGKEVVWQLAFALMEVDTKGHRMDVMGDVRIEEWMGRRGDDWERLGGRRRRICIGLCFTLCGSRMC